MRQAQYSSVCRLQRLRQDFRHVAGTERRQVFDLMATACAGGGQNRSRRLMAQFFDKRLGDFQRQFVFGIERAERSGHPATAGVEQSHFPSGQTLSQPNHV